MPEIARAIHNDMIAGPGLGPTWYYTPEFLAASTDGAASVIDGLNAAIQDVATDHEATVVDMAVVANGPDGTQAIPEGWFSKDFGDLNQTGHESVRRGDDARGLRPSPRA